MSDRETEVYPPYNFSWVIPGTLAGMGWPQTKENLEFLVKEGVYHLVSLSPEKRPPILECTRLEWTEIPIKEFQPPTIKQIVKFIDICQRCKIMGKAVGIHCRHGRGRTGVMLAAYLVYFQQLTPERAILNIRLKRPGSCETYQQEQILCRYHDALRGLNTVDYRLVDDKSKFDFVYKKETNQGVALENRAERAHSEVSEADSQCTQNQIDDLDFDE